MIQPAPSIIDTRFQYHNRIYRVTATSQYHIIGTLIHVEGEPTSPDQMAILTRSQFEHLPQPAH